MEVIAVLTKSGAVEFKEQWIPSHLPSAGGRGEGPTSFWTCGPILVCNSLPDLLDTKRLDSVPSVQIKSRCVSHRHPLGTKPWGPGPDFGGSGAGLPPTPVGAKKDPRVAISATFQKKRTTTERRLSSSMDLAQPHSWSVSSLITL